MYSTSSHRFPVQIEDVYTEDPVHIKAPDQPHEDSKVENLPPEIFTLIASHVTSISDLLSFAATSHRLQYIVFGLASNRDAIARAWIRCQAPWYIPPEGGNVNAEPNEEVQSMNGTCVGLSWAYLRQCCASGSMRNRKRIWRVVESLEEKADELSL